MPFKSIITVCFLIIAGLGVVSAQDDQLNPFSIDDDTQVLSNETESESEEMQASKPIESPIEEASDPEPKEENYTGDIEVPELTSPVIDQAGLLKSNQVSRLDSKIRGIYQKGGPQIQLLIVSSLQGLTIEQYSIKVAEKWKIGRKEKGDGVIILMSSGDREVRIEVGEGAEGDLTDVESHQIIQYGMIPEFRSGNFYAGFDQAINSISGEFGVTIENADMTPPKELAKVRRGKKELVSLMLPLIIFFVTFPFILKLLGKNSLVRSVAGGAYLGGLTFFLVGHLFFIVLAVIFGIFIGLIGPLNFLMVMMSSSGRGRYGGGGFGGGGGGWSGGGGGFSGGGASGSW